MKAHKIRTADPIDGTKIRHKFVRVEKNRWLGVKIWPQHETIHNLLKEERESNTIYIGFANRAFHIGLIKNWREEGYIR